MTVLFDFVALHHVVDEIKPNVARHYEEMTDGDDYGVPDIDWDSYLAASVAGHIKVVTMRDDGKLVGYGAFTVGFNPRYKTILEATSDGIFIEKPYRGKYAQQFLRKCDFYLIMLGVREINYTLSDERIGKLLARNGYKQKYKVYGVTYGQQGRADSQNGSAARA